MKKVILVPDSFKGSISSIDASRIMTSAILSVYPDCEVKSIPVADGGEGTVEAFLMAVGGKRMRMKATGPFIGETLDAEWALLENGTAVIEAASTVGLPLVEGRLDPLTSTSWGIGEELLETARLGIKRVVVGLGGSCTNDGGCGFASAIGIRFLDREGRVFTPTGSTLSKIDRIDMSSLDEGVRNLEIKVMCDVNNPFYGKEGAAFVYAPQKGASKEDVVLLDEGLMHLASKIKETLGIDLESIPGSGAAGGMGGAFKAFLGAELQMGIDVLLDTTGFDELLKGADAVFTGEGRIDSQSARGKVVSGVMKRANSKGVRTLAFVGDIGDGVESLYSEGLSGVFSINRVALPFTEARKRSREDLFLTVQNVMNYTKSLDF